jgi:hypothetical protein
MAKKITTNKDVIDAPSADDILKDMEKSAPVNDVMKEMNELLTGYTEKLTIDEPAAMEGEKKKRGRPSKSSKVEEPINEIQGSSVISGSLLILLIDLILPNIMAAVNNKVSKKKIKASLLQMTPEQRKELEPVADAVSREMMLKANPLAMLIISMIGIYGVNLMMLKNE